MDAPEPVSPSLHCPTCGGVLRAGKLHDVPMGRCAACHGSLVIQHDLVRLLGGLNAALAARLDPDATIEAVPPITTPVPCARCGEPMERVGYLGANQVQPHICSECTLVWIAAHELVGMWQLFARSERQAAVIDRELNDIQSPYGPKVTSALYLPGPTPAQLLDYAARSFTDVLGPVPLLLDIGLRVVGRLPVPDWLRLAEPPTPPKGK